MADSEKRHSFAKHHPFRGDEDELARRKKKFYREKRPDLDPQSTASRALETVGLDEPYRNDEGSLDYRRQALQETGDPSWASPLNDADTETVMGAIERALGGFAPLIRGGAPPVQRPSRDERVLKQLSAEDRTALAKLSPDQADAIIREINPDWTEKQNPFPDEWFGAREREGDARIGWMPHLLDQFNLSPYSTEDILSLVGPDSPESVGRDIQSWKGGSSSLDRTIADIVGGNAEGPETQNPWVDPVEWGSTAIMLGIPGIVASTGKAVAKGGKQVVSAGNKVVKAVAARTKKPPTYHQPTDVRTPTWPEKLPSRKMPKGIEPGATLNTAQGGSSVRDAINAAMQRERMRTAAQSGLPLGAATGIGTLGLGGAAYTAGEALRRKRERE